MLRSTVRCRRHGELTIIINLAPGLSMNLRVTLLNQPKYSCCGGISPSTTSKRRWRRLPQSSICIACFHIQLTPTFPLKSILWRTSLVSTSRGISWIILNWQTTWSSVCLYFKIHQTYKIVPKHVKQGIFISGLATLKLFARNTCPWRCGQAYFSCLGPTTTYNNQEEGINI